MSSRTVTDKGPYYNLPTFPDHDGKQYTAIVTGANGISGAYISRVLSESPQRWKTIYALSRRPPVNPLGGNVKYLSLDFLSTPEEIAKVLVDEHVKADYVFFTSYVQPPPKEGEGLWSDVEETERINVQLLSNFLQALTLAKSVPKRFILQTGGKHYNLHYGPTLTPMEESDPRFPVSNFYYPQEDLLWKWSRENNTTWNVTRPGFILGAVREAAMNLTYPLALYASVQKELGQSLDFPGDIVAWDAEKHDSSSGLIGYHAEWAALTDSAANQALNIVNGDSFSYGKFWPLLAAAYGIPYSVPELDESKYQTSEMPQSKPPRGFGGPGKVRVAWSFVTWAKKSEVREAWARLKEKHNLVLDRDPFAEEHVLDFFGLLDGEVLTPWPRIMSMTRSRKRGWNGIISTEDALFETIKGLTQLKMLPPVTLNNVEKDKIKYHGY